MPEYLGAEHGYAFVALDLSSGTLWTHAGDSMIKATPLLVTMSWVMRWPIPLLAAGCATSLLTAITPHATALCSRVELLVSAPAGIMMRAGAGASLDAIHWAVAEAWHAHYMNPPGPCQACVPHCP